jgi:hypothetical protein
MDGCTLRCCCNPSPSMSRTTANWINLAQPSNSCLVLSTFNVSLGISRLYIIHRSTKHACYCNDVVVDGDDNGDDNVSE